jgi:DNA-binding HxlR family transcriptional regulator
MVFKLIDVVVTPRMLSKELQEMEINELISRTVYEAKPIAVEYAITEYGMTLEKVLFEMAEWGKNTKDELYWRGDKQ